MSGFFSLRFCVPLATPVGGLELTTDQTQTAATSTHKKNKKNTTTNYRALELCYEVGWIIVVVFVVVVGLTSTE